LQQQRVGGAATEAGGFVLRVHRRWQGAKDQRPAMLVCVAHPRPMASGWPSFQFIKGRLAAGRGKALEIFGDALVGSQHGGRLHLGKPRTATGDRQLVQEAWQHRCSLADGQRQGWWCSIERSTCPETGATWSLIGAWRAWTGALKLTHLWP